MSDAERDRLLQSVARKMESQDNSLGRTTKVQLGLVFSILLAVLSGVATVVWAARGLVDDSARVSAAVVSIKDKVNDIESHVEILEGKTDHLQYSVDRLNNKVVDIEVKEQRGWTRDQMALLWRMLRDFFRLEHPELDMGEFPRVEDIPSTVSN